MGEGMTERNEKKRVRALAQFVSFMPSYIESSVYPHTQRCLLQCENASYANRYCTEKGDTNDITQRVMPTTKRLKSMKSLRRTYLFPSAK